MKLLNHLNKFKEEARKYNVENTPVMLASYVYWKMKYKTNLKDFFRFRLYNLKENHDDYIKKNNTYTRTFRYTCSDFFPDASKLWYLTHYIDYLLQKLLYKGLDGRDYFQYKFYQFRHCVKRTFVTEGYLSVIDNYFNGGENRRTEREMLDNKPLFNAFLSDIISRKWLLVSPENKEEFIEFCLSVCDCLFKPADGIQGKGIFREVINSREKAIDAYEIIKDLNYLVEERVEQAQELNEINDSSVNTVRIITVKKNDAVYIMNAAIRFGRNGSATDNFSSGGVIADIDLETGIVTSRAVTKKGETCFVHPGTKKQITGITIPNWTGLKDTIIEAHKRFTTLGYIAWDVAIKKDHSITIIEANTGGGMNTQQFPSLIGQKPKYDALMK